MTGDSLEGAMTMNAEIITSGTELLLGEIVDTNSTYIARALRDAGVNLYYKTSVGDNIERMALVLCQSLQRSDVIIITGGLGPDGRRCDARGSGARDGS